MNCFPKKPGKLVVFELKTGPSGCLIGLVTLDVRNRENQTIPFTEKNPDQKILFFHGEIPFSKFGFGTSQIFTMGFPL